MFKHEPGGDGQIDTGNPQCLTLTCLQTHFSWGGMRAKQNRMLSRERFASEEGGDLRLGFEKRDIEDHSRKSLAATYMAFHFLTF